MSVVGVHGKYSDFKKKVMKVINIFFLMRLLLESDIRHISNLTFLRSFDCLLKHTLLQQLQMLWVKGEDLGLARELENAETWRKERPSLPLSLSCYTLVFSLAEPLPSLLCATWAAQRNTWRVTPVGGVMMEKATWREKT